MDEGVRINKVPLFQCVWFKLNHVLSQVHTLQFFGGKIFFRAGINRVMASSQKGSCEVMQGNMSVNTSVKRSAAIVWTSMASYLFACLPVCLFVSHYSRP